MGKDRSVNLDASVPPYLEGAWRYLQGVNASPVLQRAFLEHGGIPTEPGLVRRGLLKTLEPFFKAQAIARGQG